MPTYNLKEVILDVAGIRIEGFGETDAISFEAEEDSWVKTRGADGELTWSKTNNDGGMFTVNLMATSFSNAVLQTAQIFDQLAGDRTFPLMVADLSTGWQLMATECRIMRSPGKPFAKTVGEISWQIGAAHIKEIFLAIDFFDDFGGQPSDVFISTLTNP